MRNIFLSLVLATVPLTGWAQSDLEILPFQAAALFDRARSSLPCMDRFSAVALDAGLTLSDDISSHDFALRLFRDADRALALELAAEDTPLGTQFITRITVEGTDPAYRDELEQGLRIRTGLPAANAMPALPHQSAGWRFDFGKGPTIIIIEFNAVTGTTVVYAAVEPIKPGTPLGC